MQPNTMLRLTYAELADRLALPTPAAARMLARRRMWRVEAGNDRKVRVLVVEGDLAAEGERQAERAPARAGDDRQHDRVHVRQEEGVVHRLHVQLDLVEREATELRGQVAELRLDLARAVAERDAAQAQVATTAAVAAARAEAREHLVDELREALAWHRRPWWRRLSGR